MGRMRGLSPAEESAGVRVEVGWRKALASEGDAAESGVGIAPGPEGADSPSRPAGAVVSGRVGWATCESWTAPAFPGVCAGSMAADGEGILPGTAAAELAAEAAPEEPALASLAGRSAST